MTKIHKFCQFCTFWSICHGNGVHTQETTTSIYFSHILNNLIINISCFIEKKKLRKSRSDIKGKMLEVKHTLTHVYSKV